MISAMACPPSMPGFGAHRMDPAPDFGSLQRPASTPESPTMESRQHLWLGAHQHGDHRLAGLAGDVGECVEQRVLAAEQFKRGGGTGLADQLHHIAHDGDDEVGLARGGDGLVEQGPVNGRAHSDLRARLAVRVELTLRVGHEVDDVGTAGVGNLASRRRRAHGSRRARW